SSSELVSLQPDGEEARNCTQKQQPAPYQIRPLARAPEKAYRHAREEKQIEKGVTNCLHPAAEIGFLKLQTSDLTVTSVENACRHRQNRAHQHIPITAERVERTGNEADTQGK